MWTRVQLKEKAKLSFKRNYWKTVLMAALASLMLAGASYSSSGGVANRVENRLDRSDLYEDYIEGRDFVNGFADGWQEEYEYNYSHGGHDDYHDDYYDGYDNYYDHGNDYDLDLEGFGSGARIAFFATFVIVFLVIFLIVLALAIALDTLILNPLEVGSTRFFYRNLNEQAEVREIGYAFDHNYKNVMITMFFKGLYTFLWSLLFVIPGIVKSYEYRMIPYILAEHPDMPREQAFAISRQMMDGNKWKAFVLDLSFIPWHLLSAITAGIVAIFYVSPYVYMTRAALYEALKYEGGRPYDMYVKTDMDPMGGMGNGMNMGASGGMGV